MAADAFALAVVSSIAGDAIALGVGAGIAAEDTAFA